VAFYAGRLVPEKNLSLLLETMELLDPAVYRLAIAGTGIQMEYLQRECTRKRFGNVTFLGHVADRETLAGYYANADVFLHPNPREPYGIAPLEAMASGLPLIAPAAGGVTSYADETNAWLVQATAAAFSAAVRTVQADPVGSLQKTSAARATAVGLSWPRVAERHLRLYRELSALTNGIRMADTIAARTWSTPGDMFGREAGKL
jgi:glycosyltransferase involved in cell wall biosynthesis